jgi:hypothetical protein
MNREDKFRKEVNALMDKLGDYIVLGNLDCSVEHQLLKIAMKKALERMVFTNDTRKAKKGKRS